jgi:hypothetical protein
VTPATRTTTGDGLLDVADNCRTVANPGQEATIAPPRGDACLVDTDADGVYDDQDRCRTTADPAQRDADDDGVDLCDLDDDNDTWLDTYDNCPAVFNPPPPRLTPGRHRPQRRGGTPATRPRPRRRPRPAGRRPTPRRPGSWSRRRAGTCCARTAGAWPYPCAARRPASWRRRCASARPARARGPRPPGARARGRHVALEAAGRSFVFARLSAAALRLRPGAPPGRS